MTAREVFYERIGLLRELSADPLLTDVFPHSDAHNIRATILRNGLVISSFSLLEKYLQDRIDENIENLMRTSLSYVMLGDKLRKLLSLDAILGLGNRIGFVDKAERLAFAEEHIFRLAGHPTSPIGYTGLGFSPKGSNVSADDLQALLSAFTIENPWQALGRIASATGATRVSLQSDFVNLARARNKAAHDSTTNTPTENLRTHIDTALLIGMGTDILLTNAVTALVRKRTLAEAALLANSTRLSCRFLDEDENGHWNEKIGADGRTIKRYTGKSAAKNGAMMRTGGALIILRDRQSIPMELV